jgi:hypothetical protein
MKATITINKKDALLAGFNNEGKYDIEFDPADLTEEERNELVNCDFNVTRSVVPQNATSGYTYKSEWGPALDTIHRPIVPTIDEIKKVLRDRIRVRKELEKIEAALIEKQWADNVSNAVKWSNMPPEKRIEKQHYMGSFQYFVSFPFMGGMYPQKVMADIARENTAVKEAIEDAESLAFWLNLERNVIDLHIKLERDKKKAKEKAEKEALKIRRKAQIGAWVAKHGDENMKARYAEGFLADTEVIDAIRNQTFRPLDGFPRYEKLKASDVCQGYEEYGFDEIRYHDVDFTVQKDNIVLTAEEFDRLQEIRAIAPKGAIVSPRNHVARCSDCDNTISRLSFRVEIKVGEFLFSREYQ